MSTPDPRPLLSAGDFGGGVWVRATADSGTFSYERGRKADDEGPAEGLRASSALLGDPLHSLCDCACARVIGFAAAGLAGSPTRCFVTGTKGAGRC